MGFVVICRSDATPDGDAEYVPATRRIWPERIGAERYASTVAQSRRARVLTSDEYLMAFENWRGA